jgi:protein-S-isoprenylcysteine O-methyltransferase Ste14
MRASERSAPRTLLLPPLPFAVAIAGGWWLDRHVHVLPLPRGGLPLAAGLLLIGTAVLVFVWALVTLRRQRTTVNPYRAATALCTDGPFGFSRNPIYVADWLVLAGFALVLGTAWPLVFAPPIWLLIRFGVIRHEEAHLEAVFGEAYRAYRGRVRRWL